MSVFSGISFKPRDVLRGGTPIVQLLHNVARDFNSPATEGLSESEQRAIDQYNSEQQDRRRRLAEMSSRRGRVALGVQGGSRTLLYGNFSGVTRTLGEATPLGGT